MPHVASRRSQGFVLPPHVDDWVAPDHPVRFVWSFVQSLDLMELGIEEKPSSLGTPSYPPRELLACWIYGFFDGVRSSRRLERACRESLPVMWLMGLMRPDHVTLWRFYARHRKVMRKLFRRTVKMAVDRDMVDFVIQAIDGTKVPVARNERLLSKKGIEKLLARVSDEIATMEASEDLASQDQASDPPTAQGQHNRALAKKKDQKRRLLQAQDRICEQEQRQGQGKKKIVAPVTDPEAVLLRTRSGWQLGYNAQAAVDGKSEMIITTDVVAQGYDYDQLAPLLEAQEQELGRIPETTLADAGYFSGANVAFAEGRTDLYVPERSYRTRNKSKGDYHYSKFVYVEEHDCYICPQGKLLRYCRTCKRKKDVLVTYRQYRCDDCRECPVHAECTSSERGRTVKRQVTGTGLGPHRSKMETDKAKDLIKLRPHMVETVFGIIKEQLGGARFLLRGLEKVRQEWFLLCAAYNLRKMYKNWLESMQLAA